MASITRDVFGEPRAFSRIGDEHQAELPQVIEESDYLSNQTRAHSHESFLLGLPMPLTNNVNYINGDDKPNMVPGLLGENWSDDEKDSFALGLYMFDKNFVEVRRFIETKKMCDVLSYYYGEFYGSPDYARWSERRMTKAKRYVSVRRIFLGLTQQEFLSRLFLKVSKEIKSALLEVSKAFGNEKMSLVDYLLSLKAAVGVKALQEALGIGQGEKDLTRVEPLRSKKVIPARPNIPTGKAWASLETSEIIKFLPGGYRLSKTKSNEMFWEAIWPRLLTRGWHSEQPEGKGRFGHSLVFLAPGVEKFSRSELVRGDHYFDSVADVLGRVANEPSLIELDDDRQDNQGEHVSTSSENKSDEDRDNDELRNRVKFTVVDTSLSGGKVRYVRTLEEENGESDLKDEKKIRRKGSKSVSSRNKRRRLISDDDTRDQEMREGAVGSSEGPGSHNGPSPQIPDVNNSNENLSNSRTTRLSIDLNASPQMSEEDEQDNNEARNDPRGVVTNDPIRHSKRSRPPSAKAIEALTYHEYVAANFLKRRG